MAEHPTPLPPSLAEPALVELALLQSHGAVNAPAIAAALHRLKELEHMTSRSPAALEDADDPA
ncbi:hypothetical protein EBT31_21745 [bacterium]|nr:hypothetical protein [bacterium]